MFSDVFRRIVYNDVMETRQCGAFRFPDLGGRNRKSSTDDRRKSEGWYNETVDAGGTGSVDQRQRVLLLC